MGNKIGKIVAGAMMLAASGEAVAQETSGQAAGAANTTAPGAAQPQSGGSIASIEEVIVTAQRFTETAQKTPLILSVIDPEMLKGVSDVRQLQSLDPGIQLGGSGGVTQTFIRGVGSANVLSGQESAIAYNADGVFLFSPAMISPMMYDLERIEVLKGPQGTLYGRNASGGAINIITSGAKLGETAGYIEGEVGNFERLRATGAVNLPLSDSLAVRIAGQHVEHEGYLSDGTEDQDMTSGRVRVLWKPSDKVSLQVGADVSHQGGRGPGSSLNPNNTGEERVGSLDPRANTGATSLLSLPPLAAPFVDNDQWSINAQLDVDLGFATLTVVPAYRYQDMQYLDYVPGFADTHPIDETKQRSLEARLASRTDNLKWVVGAFYFDVDQVIGAGPRQELFGQDSSLSVVRPGVSSYAFFGEATFSLTDTFRVTGGLRYTKDETTNTGTVNERIQAPPFPGPGPSTAAFNPYDPIRNPTGEFYDYSVNQNSSSDAVSWKIGVELDLSPDSLVFATASRGFKGGGTYINQVGFPDRFDPEYLTAFEIGSRNRFLDNSLQINGELFYWKLKDQQLTYLGFNSVQQVTLVTSNAGEAHMYGGNLDVVWKIGPNDTLRGAVEYTKSKYDRFDRSVPSAFVLATSACDAIGYAGPASFAPVTIDCSGQPLLRAPEWAASAGYEHRFDLSNGDTLTFNADLTFASSRFLSINFRPLSRQGASTLVNGSLAYEMANPNVTITGWVRNIGDERILASTDNDGFFDNFTRPVLMAPRTYGASVRYAF